MTLLDQISDFVNDYPRALQAGIAADNKLQSDASAISADYAAIVTLSARQAFAATELTISKNADGTYNVADKLVFMKEISSNGNMNTVDVIFPAWPIYLYYNVELGRYLLEALFRYQESGLYPNKWSIHDLYVGFTLTDNSKILTGSSGVRTILRLLVTTMATMRLCQSKVSQIVRLYKNLPNRNSYRIWKHAHHVLELRSEDRQHHLPVCSCAYIDTINDLRDSSLHFAVPPLTTVDAIFDR